MNFLTQPLASLGRTGKSLEKKLRPLGIETCEDLIFYFPRRFDDFSLILPIADLRPQITATIRGRIDMIANRRSRRSRMIVTEALVSDSSGSVKLVWFNQPFLTKNLRVGDWVSISGKTNDLFYDLQMVSPAYEKMGSGTREWGQAQFPQKLSQTPIEPDPLLLHTGRIVPVYSLPANVTQKQYRHLCRAALDRCLHYVNEWLPSDIRAHEQYPDLTVALLSIHFPENREEYDAAVRRFKFEELFLLQLFCAHLRQSIAAQFSYTIPFDKKITKRLIAGLPYTLTKEQKIVAWEILCDMQKTTPMSRLLQGDVGSGKTIVAILAMLNVVNAGYQCAFMAPTEVLAQQHFQTLQRILEAFDISIVLLTANNALGNSSFSSRSEILNAISAGAVDIIIGTHALIQEKVRFANIALAVVDEQHRFGVNQRKTLRKKNSTPTMPHVLSMTATPIPRSLALTVYGDLDISTIRKIPKGRAPIITKIVPSQYRTWTYDFICKQVARGRQAFVLCPIIDGNGVSGNDTVSRSVTDEYERLKSGPFGSLRVAKLHGRMKADEKERVMREFCDGLIDILVTTSVVEVGIDVPNANVILIEGAERFGLAQLHQLRGRVGRAHHQSYCFLAPTEESKEEFARLKAVVSSNDGFALAEQDLALRKEGDILGLRQSGLPRLSIATLIDIDLIQKARSYAVAYYAQQERYPELKKRIDTFQRKVHRE